jgi:ATP-dependent DNA helicase RecG
MVELKTVNRSQADKILQYQEGHLVDLKAIEIKPGKLTKFVSAFANADGGEIYVGISEVGDSRTWTGFLDMEAANGHLQAIEEMRPFGGHYEANFLTCDGLPGLVLKIEIPKNSEI